MSAVLKPTGIESVCNTTTFSSYGNSALVRIAHSSAVTTSALITCKDSTNTNTNWTMSIIGGDTVVVQKGFTDILTSNSTDTSVTAVSCAYKN